MGYCFYCDRPVDGEKCPTCGRAVWTDQPPAASPLGDRTEQDWQGDLPPVEAEAPSRRREIKPWMVALAVVGIGLLLSIVTIPSGFQHITAPTPPPVTTTTTTTIPRPGATRPPYQPAEGTWLGLLSSDAPPETLTGTFPFLEPALDVMPGGSLLTVTDDTYVRVSPDGGHTPLPIPGPSDLLDIALSPDGRLLATVDLDGRPSVWDPITGEKTELDKVTYSISPDSASLHWSPDSGRLGIDLAGQSYYVWSVEGILIEGPVRGRLIAVGPRGAVAQDDEGLRIDGGSHLLPGNVVVTDIGEGAFSPDGDYLALEARIEDVDSAILGLWLLETAGTGQWWIATPDASFAWSGDGAALYWADADGVHAHPIGAEYGYSRISVQAADPEDRLKVYDPALVPAPTLLVDSGRLFELRDSVLFRRDPDGLHLIGPPDAGTTTSIHSGYAIDPSTPLLRTVSFGLPALDVLTADVTGTTEATLGSLPIGAESVVAAGFTPEGSFLETDQGQILRVDEDGLTPVLSGTSLGAVGSIPFAISDSSAIVTVPAGGDTSTTLVEASDLPGTRRILAAVGIRSDLLVLTKTQIGTPAVFFIPGDSELLRDAVLPNSPITSPTPFSLITTPPEIPPVSSGRIVSAGDGQTFAVEMTAEDGFHTLIMADPRPGQRTCLGIVACYTASFVGRTLGFSPDGSWLLVESEGQMWAVSTRGRGVLLIDIAAPDQIAWIPPS